jgi:toxin YoeB
MKVLFSSRSFEQFLLWNDEYPKMFRRVAELITASMRQPFTGLGKPEPLRNKLSGWWSRRITQEHRLVYRVTGKGEEQTLEIAACRFHYG